MMMPSLTVEGSVYLYVAIFFLGEISVHISVGPFGPKRTYIYPSRAA